METNNVFICGAHKSGASLLRSLFYGHSEIGVVPIETHSPVLFGCPSINPMYSQVGHYKIAITRHAVRRHLQNYFNSESKLSDARVLTGNLEDLLLDLEKLDFTAFIKH